MKLKFNGSKTYAAGAALIAYVVTSALTGQPIEQEIVYGLLAAMGLALRHGVAKAEKAGAGARCPECPSSSS